MAPDYLITHLQHEVAFLRTQVERHQEAERELRVLLAQQREALPAPAPEPPSASPPPVRERRRTPAYWFLIGLALGIPTIAAAGHYLQPEQAEAWLAMGAIGFALIFWIHGQDNRELFTVGGCREGANWPPRPQARARDG
jgi:ferric-dicitrate binding protein FerR (iron transport regulator)